MTDDRMATRVGMILNGRYKVTKRLGSGAMGVVYLGEQTTLGRKVAIKFLNELHLDNDQSMARFAREAKAMSMLSHPHCVSVFDYGIEGAPYLVMDYVSGTPLDVILKTEKLSFARIIRIVLQVLAGLAHAHRLGIVHRDVKPDNILITRAEGTGEHALLIDFSLAKLRDVDDASLTGAFTIMGTPYYMSPEQSLGKDVDHRSDIYSVGVILYEALTGRKPFDGDSIEEIMRGHREETMLKPSEVVKDLSYSPEIEAVMAKALAKSRDARFASAEEFSAALQKVPEVKNLGNISFSDIGATQYEGAETVVMGDEEQLASTGRPVANGQLPRKTKFRVFTGAVIVTIVIGAAAVTYSVVQKKEDLIHSAPVPPAKADEKQSPEKSAEPEVDKNELSRVGKLLEGKNSDEAIALLQTLRLAEPKNPILPYLLGCEFAKRHWWTDAMARFDSAMELDPNYRNDPVMINHLIEALRSEKASSKVGRFLSEKVGESAIPFLEKAMEAEKEFRIKRRMARLLGSIRRGGGSG